MRLTPTERLIAEWALLLLAACLCIFAMQRAANAVERCGGTGQAALAGCGGACYR